MPEGNVNWGLSFFMSFCEMSDQKAFHCHLSGWPRQFGQLLHLSV